MRPANYRIPQDHRDIANRSTDNSRDLVVTKPRELSLLSRVLNMQNYPPQIFFFILSF